jgi:hypothetical protein
MACRSKLLMTITCDHEDDDSRCSEHLALARDACEMSLSRFGDWAQGRAIKLGWSFFGGTKCPKHSGHTTKKRKSRYVKLHN